MFGADERIGIMLVYLREVYLSVLGIRSCFVLVLLYTIFLLSLSSFSSSDLSYLPNIQN